MKVFGKLFFSFLGAVFLASMISGALFYYILYEKPGTMFSDFILERAQALRAITLELLEAQPGNEAEKARLLAGKYSRLAAASVWFIKNDAILASSGSENLPPMEHKVFDAGGARLFHTGHSWTMSLQLDSKRSDGLALVVRIHRREKRHKEGLLFSIIGIMLAFALLLYPVSRILSKPLAELRDSVLALAGGDLSTRANISNRDEIGELARSFNLMAERISHLIQSARELNAHVSHELRSPLARMRIALELHRNKNSNLNDVRHLESMQSEIEHLDALVGKILLLARLESGSQIEKTDCRLDHLLNSQIKFSQEARAQDSSGALIRADLAPVQIKTDAGLLRSALSNLLDNALKFASQNSVIELGLSESAAGVQILLSNEAPGLSADFLNDIFKPFARGPNAGPEQDGSGLGLALTRRIIEALGGKIEARLHGSRFIQEVRL